MKMNDENRYIPLCNRALPEFLESVTSKKFSVGKPKPPFFLQIIYNRRLF